MRLTILVVLLVCLTLPAAAQSGAGLLMDGSTVRLTVASSLQVADLWGVPLYGDVLVSSQPYVGLGLSVPPLSVADAIGIGGVLSGPLREVAGLVTVGAFAVGSDFRSVDSGGVYWRLRLGEVRF